MYNGDENGTELNRLGSEEKKEEQTTVTVESEKGPAAAEPEQTTTEPEKNSIKESPSVLTKEDDKKETEVPTEQTKFLPRQVTVEIEETLAKMSGGSVVVKIGCAAAVVVVAVITGICLSNLHTIDEGHIGIYYKYGALMEKTTIPGIHYMAPFVTSVKQVLIRSETDTLGGVEAITRDGIQISFDQVQVISRVRQDKVVKLVRKYGANFKKPLVFDRVREDIRIFCANNSIDDVYNTRFLDIVEEVKFSIIDSIHRLGEDGIEILNLVIPKPDIPQDISNNYKQVKVQWTEQLVASQQQKTEAIKKETEQLVAIADANRKKSVLQITIEEKMLEREGERNVSRITNEIQKERAENIANIEKYKVESAAEANRALYTKEYIQLNMAKALSNNTKFYFSGDQSALGSIMSKILN